jgi:hypothetical protein
MRCTDMTASAAPFSAILLLFTTAYLSRYLTRGPQQETVGDKFSFLELKGFCDATLTAEEKEQRKKSSGNASVCHGLTQVPVPRLTKTLNTRAHTTVITS